MAPAIDAFTVRGKREKRRKGGAPWGPVVAVPLPTSGGTGVALVGVDTVAELCTAAGREEDEEADRWGPSISGREGGEGGASEAGLSW
jgi:hypothetical protein